MTAPGPLVFAATTGVVAAATGATVAGRFGWTGSFVTDGLGSAGLVRSCLPDWTAGTTDA